MARTPLPGGSVGAGVRSLGNLTTPAVLDDVYAEGIGARARAATELANLDDMFDALDDQMAALLARTEELLDHTD